MKPTFKADVLQERFEKYGYVIIRNFITPGEIKFLSGVYAETQDIIADKSFYISQWTDKHELKMKINAAVDSVLAVKAQQYLNGYVPVFAVFGVKHPKPDSAMYLHADWTHVDETKFRTVNVWCPLLQIDEKNGAICLVKGSSRLFDYVRGVNIPDTFSKIGEKTLAPYLTDIYLNAGDVIMWDHAVIHGSRTNVSNGPRVAAIINMRPKESEFYLYYGKPSGKPKSIEVFSPPQDFFVANDSANDPDLIKHKSVFVDELPYKDPNVSEEILREFLLKEFPEEFPQLEQQRLAVKQSFLQKLFGRGNKTNTSTETNN